MVESKHRFGLPKAGAKTVTKPSDRLKTKIANPFGGAAKKHKTNFGYAYVAGAVPFRIDHGCNSNRLKWD